MKTSLAYPRKAPLALNPPEFTHLSGERRSLPVPASHLARRGSPGAQGPQGHPRLGPDLSIHILSYQHKAFPVSPPPPNSRDFRTTVTFRCSHFRQGWGIVCDKKPIFARHISLDVTLHPPHSSCREPKGLGKTTAAVKHWGSSSGNRFGFLQEFFSRFFVKGINGSHKQNIKPPVSVLIMEVFPEVRATFPNMLP